MAKETEIVERAKKKKNRKLIRRPPRVFLDKKGNKYIMLNGKKIKLESATKDNKSLVNIVIKNMAQERKTKRMRVPRNVKPIIKHSTKGPEVSSSLSEVTKTIIKEDPQIKNDISQMKALIPTIQKAVEKIPGLKSKLKQLPSKKDLDKLEDKLSQQKMITPAIRREIEDMSGNINRVNDIIDDVEIDELPKKGEYILTYPNGNKQKLNKREVEEVIKAKDEVVNLTKQKDELLKDIINFQVENETMKEEQKKLEQKQRRMENENETLIEERKKMEEAINETKRKQLETKYKLKEEQKKAKEQIIENKFNSKIDVVKKKQGREYKTKKNFLDEEMKKTLIKTYPDILTNVSITNPNAEGTKYYYNKLKDIPEFNSSLNYLVDEQTTPSKFLSILKANLKVKEEREQDAQREQELEEFYLSHSPFRTNPYETKKEQQKFVPEEEQKEEEEDLYKIDDDEEGNGKRKGKGGLWNYEIEEIMADYKPYGFKGVISSDQILDLLPKIKKGERISFIMNLDTSEQRGSHWVAVYIDPISDMSLEYYDPLIGEPSKQFQEDIKQVINKLEPETYLKFKINRIQDQNANSKTCGWHSIRFLQQRYKDKPFKEATLYNAKKGEAQVKQLKKQYGFGYI